MDNVWRAVDRAVEGVSPWSLSVGAPTIPRMDRPKLMTAAQVQELLHVSKTTVNEWRAKGYLEAVPTPGGGWRYPTNQHHLRQALAALERRTVVQ